MTVVAGAMHGARCGCQAAAGSSCAAGKIAAFGFATRYAGCYACSLSLGPSSETTTPAPQYYYHRNQLRVWPLLCTPPSCSY